jgi:Bacterial Ig-like domain (group 3)/Domain of unknown function (DUF5122) beta-propeller
MHMKIIFACCLLGLAFCSATTWADGELDTSFGTNGAVRIAFPNSSLGYLYDAAVVNGSIEAVGFERMDNSNLFGETLCARPFPALFVVQLSLDGAVLGSAHSYPQQAVACPGGLVVDATNGDIYMVGSGSGVVARFDASGSLVSLHPDSTNGRSPDLCIPSKPLLDGQGRLVVACMWYGEFGVSRLAVRRYLLDSDLTVDYFPRVSGAAATVLRTSHGVAQDPTSGAYYVVGAGCQASSGEAACLDGAMRGVSRVQYVVRLGMDGSLDASFGVAGGDSPLSAVDGQAWGGTVDGSGSVLIAGEYGGSGTYLDSGLGYVARIGPTGTPDRTFGTNGVFQGLGSPAVDVQADHGNRVYALEARSQLVRITSRGSLDPRFSSSSQVQVLNGPGSAWQAMRYTDSTRSSMYLLGGAAACATCTTVATTAVIAKVNLDSGSSGRGSTLTMLSSTATAITTGQSVSFMATVTGTNPTGAVTFEDGGIKLGAPVALTSGRASYSTSVLAVGSHRISAVYSGDGQNATSASQVIVETVAAAPVSIGGSPASGGGASGAGGGGSFSWIDLCMLLLLGLGVLGTEPGWLQRAHRHVGASNSEHA